MPEVSVIIPTYNRASLLPQTVESARRAGTDLEVIVVDDASTDETPRICRQLEHIKYIRLEQNSGTSHARNTGIRASAGEYIAFLDDDDLRLPGTLDLQLSILKADPSAAFVYGRVHLGDPRFCLPTGRMAPEECPSGDIYWKLLEGNFVQLSSVVARRECLLEVGLFNTELEMLEDYEMWIRLAERYAVRAIGQPVAIYRGRSESSGQKTSDRARLDRNHKKMHAELLRSPRARAASWLRRKRTHRRHLTLIYYSLVSDAASALVNGDVASARDYLNAAIRMCPLHVKAHASLVWLLVGNLLQKTG
jgi:glycosyltransferase involved in cell wall biosynthesis